VNQDPLDKLLSKFRSGTASDQERTQLAILAGKSEGPTGRDILWELLSYALLFVAGVFLHAGITLVCLFSYIETAVRVTHADKLTTLIRIAQYMKAVFLWPILLQLMKNRTGLLHGCEGILFLLLNSFMWVSAVSWIYLFFLRRKRL
jgi:hypothetical protein